MVPFPTTVHNYTARGRPEILMLLVCCGTMVHTWKRPAVMGLTPLHVASVKGFLAIVQLLLNRCANIEAIGNSGRGPLHFACFRGHVDVVKLLLRRGANIEAQHCLQWTPYIPLVRGGMRV